MKIVMAGLAILAVLPGFAGDAVALSGGLPRSLLIARANSFCMAAKVELNSLTGRHGGIDARSPAARRAILVLHHKLDRLRAIRPAPGAARRWRAFVGAAVTVDRRLATVVNAPPGDLRALAMLAHAAGAAAAAGVDLGARACAA